MTHVDIITNQHSFKTTLDFIVQEDGIVGMRINTECPHIANIVSEQPISLDPMLELFKSDASVLSHLADQLPHRACPFLLAALKGLEVEAGLEKPAKIQVNVHKAGMI